MLYLYLDESGDLGFDFVNKRPSKFFTICILAVRGKSESKRLEKMVERTLRVKLNHKRKRSRLVKELKATSTTLEIKTYFYEKVKDLDFSIYALTLNKKRVYQRLADNKPRVYNWIARMLLDQIDFDAASQQIVFTLDKCKNKKQISEFNHYIETQLQGKISLNIPLHLHHEDSCSQRCLNVADLFAWGIARKYERKDFAWYDCFKEKIQFDDLYLA